MLLSSLISDVTFLNDLEVDHILYFELVIAFIIVVASFAVIFSRTRLAGVAALGVIGYSIALLFIFYGAPDLAVTQILVETLTVILFVFAIYHLPRFVNFSNPKSRIRDAIIATAFGSVMTLLVLKSLSIDQLVMSDFYGEKSYLEAFGRNVVNVILVDFRGEITVLSAAAIGVYALLKLNKNSGEKP
jgi:multicomponent Na+:H+ antiporter subunit A